MSGLPPVSLDLVRWFVAERCELSAGYRVPRVELYTAWRQWCEGHQWLAAPANVFGRLLRVAVPGLGGARARTGGTSVGHYTGLRLRPASAPDGPTTGSSAGPSG